MINYKQVVDKLQSLILDDYKSRFWLVELSEHYIDGETTVFIYLCGDSNKYRLYHSELDDYVKTDKDLLMCCVENLHDVFSEIISVMSNLLDSGYVMLGEIE